jgi:predicted transcriptional regulator
MAQETLNGLLQYLLATLSYDNRTWLSQHLIEPQVTDASAPYTMEEIDARLDESERQIAAGEFYTTEEVLTDLRRLVA